MLFTCAYVSDVGHAMFFFGWRTDIPQRAGEFHSMDAMLSSVTGESIS
jgi:hypothetical protein